MTFAPYVYSAVTSAGVYLVARMRYCSGDAHPFLRVQSGSPEVSVTYQKVEHRKSFHVISMCLYKSLTVLELRTFMRNTEILFDSTPTFSVCGCTRACALPYIIVTRTDFK